MARRKQQGPTNGARPAVERPFSLEDVLSATQQHTVPVLPATNPAFARETSANGTSPSRATHAPRRTTAYPTLADTAASTVTGETPRRTTQQPIIDPGAGAVPHSSDGSANPARYNGHHDSYHAFYDDQDADLLPPGRPTIALPALTDAQLPAIVSTEGDRQIAAVRKPRSPAIFIRGAARAPRSYVHVVPRRTGPRSFAAQFIVAMVTVMTLLAVVTLATPLGQSVAFANDFRSYADSVPWVPTHTPTPRPKPTPVPYSPPPGANPGQQAVINQIVAVFGPYAQAALAVAKCESGYDPNARNPYPIGNSHAEGVFQVLYPSTWDTTSYAADSPYNYVDNIYAAHQIFSRDGNSWREWACQP